MARPTIAQIRAQTDFQKPYMWDMQPLRFPTYAGLNAYRFNLQCLMSDTPKFTSDVAAFMIRGEQIFDPGIYKVEGSLTWTFVETVDAQIRTWMKNWVRACKNKSGTFTQLTGDFRLATQNNQGIDNYEYIMKWVFPSATNLNALDGGTSEPMQPSMTVSYTDFDENPL